MTTLPKQVQAQADEVERIEAELAAPAQPAPEPEPEPTPEPAPRPEPPVQQAVKEEDDTWKSRYLTLKGMFDAEVPRQNAEIKELRQSLADAIAKMEAAPKVQPAPAKLVTDKDTETFGEDLVDLARRAAREVTSEAVTDLQGIVEKLNAENTELKKQVTGVTEKQGNTDRASYFRELAREIPDYETINVDAGFIGWLDEVDPLSGMKRQTYLNNAFQSYDVARTATLFKAYSEQTAPPAPPPSADPELLRQVAPGTSKASSPPAANPTDRVFTSREVEQFYQDVSKGHYRGREAEQAQREAEIDLAAASGRVHY